MKSNSQRFENEETFRDIIGKYLQYWYLFIIAVVICLLIAFLQLRYATPIYEVTSSILIKGEEKSAGNDRGSIKDLELIKSGQKVDNKIEELKSRTLLERVVSELSLNTLYYLDGSFKDTEIFGKDVPIRVIFEKEGPSVYGEELIIQINDGQTFTLKDNTTASKYKFGQTIRRNYGEFTVIKSENFHDTSPIKVKVAKSSSLAGSIRASLVINSVSEDTDVLKLSLQTPVPQKGVAILNKLIEVANKEELEDKNRIANNTIKFIDERLKFLTQDLTGVEKSVEALKQQNTLTDVGSNAQMYLEKSGASSQQLADAEIQLNVLQSLERYINQSNGRELVPSSLGIQDVTLSGLISKYNELQLERQRILRTAQEGNPVVTNIDQQLTGLQGSIRENLNNIRRSLEITRNNYRANTSEFESKIRTVPSVERELQQIQRDQSVKQNLYLYLLQKREESSLALAATVNNSRIIENVNVNPIPVSPKKQLIYLCAFVIGIGLPVVGIYTKDLLNNKVQGTRDISQYTNIKILGEISHSEVKGNLVVKPNSRTTISELFRLIRTNLNFYTADINNKVILVTSTMSGEGKTFFCANLGSTLALTNKKVVILEFDLRSPKLLDGLEVSSNVGITNFIMEADTSIEELVKPINGTPNLYVIAAGEVTTNPSELLLHERVGRLIAELRESFDYIILDTSPVGQVADAFSLVPYTDSSIYLIRHNYTLKNHLQILNEMSERLKNPMIVLNDAEINNYNGYGYGYGYINNNSTKKLKLIG